MCLFGRLDFDLKVHSDTFSLDLEKTHVQTAGIIHLKVHSGTFVSGSETPWLGDGINGDDWRSLVMIDNELHRLAMDCVVHNIPLIFHVTQPSMHADKMDGGCSRTGTVASGIDMASTRHLQGTTTPPEHPGMVPNPVAGSPRHCSQHILVGNDGDDGGDDRGYSVDGLAPTETIWMVEQEMVAACTTLDMYFEDICSASERCLHAAIYLRCAPHLIGNNNADRDIFALRPRWHEVSTTAMALACMLYCARGITVVVLSVSTERGIRFLDMVRGYVLRLPKGGARVQTVSPVKFGVVQTGRMPGMVPGQVNRLNLRHSTHGYPCNLIVDLPTL
jgi:hypothetical protein